MELKYSKVEKVPFIQIDEDNKLIFSVLNEDTRLGFKWFAFSGETRQKVKYGNTGRYTTITNHESCMPTVLLEKLPKRVKAKDGPLSPPTLKKLKSVMKNLVVDGYFPRHNLDKLDKALKGEEDIFHADDFVNNDPTATESFDDVGEKKSRKIAMKRGIKRGKPLKRKIKSKITSKIKRK